MELRFSELSAAIFYGLRPELIGLLGSPRGDRKLRHPQS